MPKLRYLPATLSVLLLAMRLVGAAQNGMAQQPVVVVELFTSEGCSSCPPADALLSQLSKQRTGRGVDLILLGEHVEYWDGPGWRDRFSSPVFTQRQYDYVRKLHLATAYTPQIVIDGHLQAAGGNAGAVQRMIAEAARAGKPAAVSLKLISPDKLQVQIMVADSNAAKLQVFLAVTEDNLSTSVQGARMADASCSTLRWYGSCIRWAPYRLAGSTRPSQSRASQGGRRKIYTWSCWYRTQVRA